MKVLESRGAKTVRLEIPHVDAVNTYASSCRAWRVPPSTRNGGLFCPSRRTALAGYAIRASRDTSTSLREIFTSLLALASASIELAKTEVAVGDQWTHAAWLGEC
jgi:hypothetical protein